jgi:hypothetical protein
MMMSHSMMASSPNITGKTQLETLCSYCGHNMPVTLVARQVHLLLGLLVYRSRFLPRILGVWLMLNCFA